MNREIKFQFIIDEKHVSAGYTIEELLNMSEYDIIENMEECTCSLNENNNHCEGDCFRFENSTITGKRQFAFMKDKKGTEIYEGDKVKFDNTIMEVKCDAQGFYFHQKGWDEVHRIDPKTDNIEVIGNIYEEAELLGK